MNKSLSLRHLFPVTAAPSLVTTTPSLVIASEARQSIVLSQIPRQKEIFLADKDGLPR